MVRLILRTKPIRVAFNMLFCATVFCWAGVLPRETISGLFGRKAAHYARGWIRGANFIDSLHPHEPDHCHETWIMERAARRALGYKE